VKALIVNITFASRKFQKTCTDQKERTRTYGAECAKALSLRLTQLRAAANLEDMRNLPQARCHELKGNRKGQLAVDLKHPYRLIFEPANDPIPVKADGGLDWTQVTAINVLEVVDYHV